MRMEERQGQMVDWQRCFGEVDGQVVERCWRG